MYIKTYLTIVKIDTNIKRKGKGSTFNLTIYLSTKNKTIAINQNIPV